MNVQDIPLANVYGNPDQPRKEFALKPLEELADSIRANGLIQPIKVTPRGGLFMIVAGERRFRAHQLIGAETIRCIVESGMSDIDVLLQAIVENGQRVNVHPLEEAVAYQACLDAGVSVEELAAKLGLQQAWRVTERTCLLNLEPEYQSLARSRQLSNSQAYEMAQLDRRGQHKLFKHILAGDCPTHNALKSMRVVIEQEAAQVSFLDMDDAPTEHERSLAKSLEERVRRVVRVLQASTVDNEVVAVKKIDPSRADTLADLLKAMRGDLLRIETALRAVNQRRAA
jgi:ParB family chromosome partitioning protein